MNKKNGLDQCGKVAVESVSVKLILSLWLSNLPELKKIILPSVDFNIRRVNIPWKKKLLEG